ncbi:MAG: VOC family protein [Candidatus Hydrogenedentes bacterium]|nr:VOC family protein [Candidatus Hydrogenedentota bacterium]
MTIHGIDHINVVVTDLERSVRFYTELLGFEKTRYARLEGDWIESVVGLKGVQAEVVYVQPPAGPRIELIRYHAPAGAVLPETAQANTAGLRHVAFRVDDIRAVCARLEAAGVDVIGPPTPVPGGVVQHDAGRKSLCYFRDPDGVLLELAEYA